MDALDKLDAEMIARQRSHRPAQTPTLPVDPGITAKHNHRGGFQPPSRTTPICKVL